jgi:protein-serine/threonine kinase
MNPNSQQPNRLQLNFGFDRNNNNQQGQYGTSENARQFPTTPSTFPQPVYPNSQGQQEVWGTQQTNNGYAGNSYFGNNPFPQYSQQQGAGAGAGAGAGSGAGGGAQQPPGSSYRSPGGYDTNGLVHQFSHQNLGGGTPRSGSPYGRQPSPAQQRPRTAGAASGQQYSSFLTPQAPMPQMSSMTEEQPPAKNPDKYGDNVQRKAKVSVGTVGTFFKDSVQRARDRNARALEAEAVMKDASLTDDQKRRRIDQKRRAEAQYLRFLRTKERPESYSTIKIIGKGAFGEVKLVQKKTDNKIYALKSLVKSEMFKKDQLAHVRSERDILAESDSPWVVKLYTTFQDGTFLYMLMEFLPGGDLMTMLIKYEIFSADITRFYMAEITLAIEAVHKLGFIHRFVSLSIYFTYAPTNVRQ